MTNNLPPPPTPQAYSSNDNCTDMDRHDADLPDYDASLEGSDSSGLPQRGEYAITMDHHHGKTWWTLRVASRSRNSKSPPTFVEGDPITGTVELVLQRPDHVKAIFIIVRGLIRYSAFDSKTFVEASRTIWPNSSVDQYGRSTTANHSGDLPPGDYSWPFSISLPSQIQLSEKESTDLGLEYNGKLPPSLNVKDGHANVDYQITLRIKRSGFFHHDSKLTTSFGYVPATRPDPPSRLRALAYEENTPIPGPEIDTEGWKVFPDVHLDGTLFKSVNVCLSISLALPTPLAYPRGTAFPCALILTSSNKQAVHLLSAPNALVVEVHRNLQTVVGESMVGGVITFSEPDRASLTKANWHPADIRETGGVYSCTALGELSLPRNLVPSFTQGKFDCKYVVDVYSPEAGSFEPASHERLFRTYVTVTSLLAPGPRPRADLPPGYLAPTRPVAEKGTFNSLRMG